MSREVQAIMLMLLGGAVIRISVTDVFLRYVKPVMQPFLIVAGGFLLMLGIWALVDQLRRSRASSGNGSGSDTGSGDGDGHELGADDEFDDGHGHGPMRAAWFLLLPVFAIVLVAPPALGSFSAERDSQMVAAPVGEDLFPALPAEDPVPLSLSEYAIRAVWDDRQSLAGRTVELTGFVTPDPDGGWWLTRMSMACCAADATVTKIHVVDPPDLAADTWVKLTGRWVPGGGTNSNEAIPWIEIDEIDQVPQPKEPYE